MKHTATILQAHPEWSSSWACCTSGSTSLQGTASVLQLLVRIWIPKMKAFLSNSLLIVYKFRAPHVPAQRSAPSPGNLFLLTSPPRHPPHQAQIPYMEDLSPSWKNRWKILWQGKWGWWLLEDVSWVRTNISIKLTELCAKTCLHLWKANGSS